MHKTKGRGLLLLGAHMILFPLGALAQADSAPGRPEPLDRSSGPVKVEREPEVSNVFKDMAVVQRRAMVKENRFLLSTYGSFDLSDGPYTLYGANINPGYAINDFFEVYLNYVPHFFSHARSIVKKVESLELADDEQATIDMARPNSQYGLELVWSPLYGKDSLGSKNIVRSDTFLKGGVAKIQYEGGDSGLKFHLGVGKTYFALPWLGIRFTVSGNYIQTVLDAEKAFRFFIIVETGTVFYF